MKDFSKRQYLKYTGATLAAASLGIGGTVGSGALKNVEALDETASQVRGRGSGDRLDYERNDDGEIEFDYLDLSFETNNGDIELDDIGVDFETTNAGRGRAGELELTVDNGVYVDLEMSDGGDRVELTIEVGGEYIDFEFDADNDDVEFEAIGMADQFEDDNSEIEYRGDHIDFEWNDHTRELEIKGDVKLELEMNGTLDFEYQDDDIMIDYDEDELEYHGLDVAIEWDHRGGRRGLDDFEARRL